jgi:hypothetical protein
MSPLGHWIHCHTLSVAIWITNVLLWHIYVWGHEDAIETLTQFPNIFTGWVSVHEELALWPSLMLGNLKLWGRRKHWPQVHCCVGRCVSQSHWAGSGWELSPHSQRAPEYHIQSCCCYPGLLTGRMGHFERISLLKRKSLRLQLFGSYCNVIIHLCFLALKSSRPICWGS